MGKTTIVKEVAATVGDGAGGFYTEEIRRAGERVGFRIVILSGSEAILAHVDTKGPHRVGKYGVNIAAIESVAVPALREAIRQQRLVIIDEIGKMELFSAAFREAVSEALNSSCRILATIMLRPNPFADSVKGHPEASLLLVTKENRRQVVQEILCWLNTSPG